MNLLLKKLIHSLCTLDGRRGSAKPLLNALVKQDETEFMKRKLRVHLYANERAQIKLKNEQHVLRKVYFKYLLIRVRAKISYIAMYKRMTVLELFVRTIRKCYLDLIKKNEIPKPDEDIV